MRNAGASQPALLLSESVGRGYPAQSSHSPLCSAAQRAALGPARPRFPIAAAPLESAKMKPGATRRYGLMAALRVQAELPDATAHLTQPRTLQCHSRTRCPIDMRGSGLPH